MAACSFRLCRRYSGALQHLPLIEVCRHVACSVGAGVDLAGRVRDSGIAVALLKIHSSET